MQSRTDGPIAVLDVWLFFRPSLENTGFRSLSDCLIFELLTTDRIFQCRPLFSKIASWRFHRLWRKSGAPSLPNSCIGGKQPGTEIPPSFSTHTTHGHKKSIISAKYMIHKGFCLTHLCIQNAFILAAYLVIVFKIKYLHASQSDTRCPSINIEMVRFHVGQKTKEPVQTFAQRRNNPENEYRKVRTRRCAERPIFH